MRKLNFIEKFLFLLKLDKIITYLLVLRDRFHIRRVEKQSGQTIKYVPQGGGSINIIGDVTKFKIHPTSHLKSDTLIECSGGVEIGRYFHTGKGLTIFSHNHNWRSHKSIPYDDSDIERKVIIEDAVWFGANVTISPGAIIREGVIVASGSVVFGDIPACAIIKGNPAQIVKYRDKDVFYDLKEKGNFY